MADSEKVFDMRILPPAQYELEEIALLDKTLSGPESARKITDELFAAMERLTRFPLSAPLVRDVELRRLGYRYVVVKNYLMFYRLIGDTVYFYHIVHGKTDYPTLLRTAYL